VPLPFAAWVTVCSPIEVGIYPPFRGRRLALELLNNFTPASRPCWWLIAATGRNNREPAARLWRTAAERWSALTTTFRKTPLRGEAVADSPIDRAHAATLALKRGIIQL
jgi:hypothetical protein